MDPNIGNKGSSPKNRSTKELHIWSPRNKNLPHISATIDASSKHQLDLANTSPSGGNYFSIFSALLSLRRFYSWREGLQSSPREINPSI